MFKIFKYYIKQFRKISKFNYWEFGDKVKFIAITNVLMFALAVSFPTSKLLETLFTLFFLTSLSYFLFLVYKIILSKIARVFPKSNRQKKRFLMNEIDQMSGIEFEKLLYHLFQQQGYHVKRTPKSGDFGADLILKKRNNIIVVQAKRYSGNIGISAINEVVGAAGYYKADNKWVVTNRYFTNAAIVQAYKNKVTLLDRDNLLRMLKEFNTPKKRKKNNLEEAQWD